MTDNVGKIAEETGLTPKEVKDRIHKAKQNIPKGTGVRNPDVVVDTESGDISPKTPDGGHGDPIGNLLDP